jgi:hypothetical protein
MPYISENDREQFKYLDKIFKIENKGMLEYCIFKLLKIYMKDKTVCYYTLHDATYAAIHAGEEFKRRYLDKREDEAIKINGDIY